MGFLSFEEPLKRRPEAKLLTILIGASERSELIVIYRCILCCSKSSFLIVSRKTSASIKNDVGEGEKIIKRIYIFMMARTDVRLFACESTIILSRPYKRGKGPKNYLTNFRDDCQRPFELVKFTLVFVTGGGSIF